MYKLVLLIIVAAVSCSDLIQGPKGGRKIYDEDKEASPAIWKQINRVTVKANDTDMISRIVVKDMRPDKDGEAIIVAGGQGQKNVTIELKSPTILRGYSFHIDVYADKDQANPDIPEESVPSTGITDEVPEDVTNATHVNYGAENGSKIIKDVKSVVISSEGYEATTLQSTTGAPNTVKDIRKVRNAVYEPTTKQTVTTHRIARDFIDCRENCATEKSVPTEAGVKISTPMVNPTTHVEHSTTHVVNPTTPLEHATTPVVQSTAHAVNSTTPLEHAATPMVQSTTPVEHLTTHVAGSTTHVAGSTTHVVSSTTPLRDTTGSVASSTTARAYPKAFHDISKVFGDDVFEMKHA